MRRLTAASVAIVLAIAASGSHALIGPKRAVLGGSNWVLPGFSAASGGVDCYFAKALYSPSATACALTVTRASSGTSLLPTSAAGAAFTTYGNNVARLIPGSGVLIEESRTNFLLHSTAPATQTTGSLANGTYTLWYNGAGTATMSAGTATGCGTGVASQGNSISFTTSGAAGTCVVTVANAGASDSFQLELNPGAVSAPTSLIVTAGATAARAADNIQLTSYPGVGSAFTEFAAFTPSAPVTFATDQVAVQYDNGNNTDSARIYRASTSGDPGYRVIGGANPFATGFGSALAAGATAKIAAAFAPGAQAAAANGTMTSTNTAATLPTGTFTTIFIGSQSGSSRFMNGIVSRIAIAPTVALPAATLQADTNLNQYN